MFVVKLTKLCSNHNHVRTSIIEGKCEHMPAKGFVFTMIATPLDTEKDIRFLSTTRVQDVVNDGTTYMFHTRNSTYRLDITE